MNKYKIILTKSYIVKVNAENESDAKHFAELFTGDIIDISSNEDKKKHNFSIEEIECTVNEAFDVESFLR